MSFSTSNKQDNIIFPKPVINQLSQASKVFTFLEKAEGETTQENADGAKAADLSKNIFQRNQNISTDAKIWSGGDKSVVNGIWITWMCIRCNTGIKLMFQILSYTIFTSIWMALLLDINID